MIHLKGLSYSVGARPLFENIDWIISNNKRFALIGPNGCGKTTLLKIIKGDLEANCGVIYKPKGYTMGFLPQEEIEIENTTVLDGVLKGRQDLVDIEKEMAKLHTELENEHKIMDSKFKKLEILQHQFELQGGYELESAAKSILIGLGFVENDFDKKAQQLSGGWRMRVYLARLLLKNPDLLLLDEPTNHLDLPSLEWLENYLLTFSGSIVLVSHDRYFIDKLAQEICELERGYLTHYAGNYQFYEQQKEKDLVLLQKRVQLQHKEIDHQQLFINRFRYKNTKATLVQSRLKMLDKVDKLELPTQKRAIDFKMIASEKSHKSVLVMDKVFFSYNDLSIFTNLDLELYRGEKVALVGLNGSGKTTLTRLIVGQLKPQNGQIHIGTKVKIGYYAQHQVETLELENSIYEEISSTVENEKIPAIRHVLGLFGFSGDDVFKPVKYLSGGEKARVSLAKLLLSPCNLLIMDEPTNHLDIPSKYALEKALAEYDGTILLISHDRYFLDKLVKKVIEISDGSVKNYEGNYSDYFDHREKIKQQNGNSSSTRIKKSDSAKFLKRQQAENRQAISKDRNQLKANISEAEKLIEKLEARKIELERFLADPNTYKNSNDAESFTKEYHQIIKEIDENLEKWERYNVSLEKLLEKLEKS